MAELLVFGRLAVGTVIGIETRGGQSQAIYRTAVDQVFRHDFVDVGDFDEAVPDGFGIDDYDGAMFALVQAAGLVGADDMLEAGIFDGVFEG
jgi:hypothetical protein